MSGGKHTIPSHGSYKCLPPFLSELSHPARTLAFPEIFEWHSEVHCQYKAFLGSNHKLSLRFVLWSCAADFVRNNELLLNVMLKLFACI